MDSGPDKKDASPGYASFGKQLYFELAKMFARKRTHIGFAVFLVLELTFAVIYQREHVAEYVQTMIRKKLGLMSSFIDTDFYYSALTMAHMIVGGAVVLMGGLFLALVAGDILSKEEEDGTLRMVLSRPVTRGRLLAVKYSACAIFTFALIIFAVISSLLVGFLFWRADGGFFMRSGDLKIWAVHDFKTGLWRYLIAAPFLALSMFVVTSLAFMFSCLRMKPATATILTLALLFMDIILKRMPELEEMRHVFITSRMSAWQYVLARDPINWGAMAQDYFVLAMICGVTFFLGRTAFSRRDFKS